MCCGTEMGESKRSKRHPSMARGNNSFLSLTTASFIHPSLFYSILFSVLRRSGECTNTRIQNGYHSLRVE